MENLRGFGLGVTVGMIITALILLRARQEIKSIKPIEPIKETVLIDGKVGTLYTYKN
jgi:hypothetical protein